MKAFIFIPDVDSKAGNGHLSRCIKYAYFVDKSFKKLILIDKKNSLKNLDKKTDYEIIKFINLKKKLKELNKRFNKIYLFLDTYKKKILKIDFSSLTTSQIAVLDFKIKNSIPNIIDHTLLRNKTYFSYLSKKQKVNFGLNYFPIFNNLRFKKQENILIDFGSIKNNKLIIDSLKFIFRSKKFKKFNIIIINKFLRKKMIPVLYTQNVKIYKYIKNIDNIYSKTYFSFGSCGISLYEKSFYNIPTIAICSAKNQKFNFKNFLSKKYIISFNKTIDKMNKSQNFDYNNFEKDLINVKDNLEHKFNIYNNKKKLKDYFKNFK